MVSPELLADRNGPYSFLSPKDAFEQLTENEKRYAHHMSKAGYFGTRILFHQCSLEAPGIFDIAMFLHRHVRGDWSRLLADAAVDSSTLDMFLEYIAMVLANLGNFRSNGFRKFIPRITQQSFGAICSVDSFAKSTFDRVGELIYSETPNMIGYPNESCQSTFYQGSPPPTEEEIRTVQDILQRNGVVSLNNRIIRTVDDTTDTVNFEVQVASAEIAAKRPLESDQPMFCVTLVYGGYADLMAKVANEVSSAMPFTSSETQKRMLEALIQSIKTGDMREFKKHQEFWVQDIEPTVEISHGFIETYGDPHGARGSWQGFVGIADRSVSEKYSTMAGSALEFLRQLPWNQVKANNVNESQYENPTFKAPSFVNLTVLSHVTPEIVAGINLPNFEDIRCRFGSKNLTLGNPNNDTNLDTVAPYLHAKDREVYRKCRAKVFEVMIACHEIFGHGSGRVFEETSPGHFNFDPDDPPRDLLTNEPIKSWYRPGETWDSIFKGHWNPYEECRADAVSLILTCHKPLLKVFGYTDKSELTSDQIIYAGWLQFIHGALKGLATWNPTNRKWGHAQKQGQYVLLRCLLDEGPDILSLDVTDDDVLINLNESLIESRGVSAVSKLLLALQVYKSTANAKDGIAFWSDKSEMTSYFRKIRDVVSKKRPNRTQWVQANTYLQGSSVVLKEYPATKEGLIQSWADRDV